LARIDAELCGPAAQRSNLRWRITQLLKQKSATIPFDRLDRRKHRISRSIEHRLVVGIQLWSEAAPKRERAVEILPGDTVIHLLAHTDAEPQRVFASYHRRVVLQFKVILRTQRLTILRAAPPERA
jgi:hypothetical protein